MSHLYNDTKEAGKRYSDLRLNISEATISSRMINVGIHDLNIFVTCANLKTTVSKSTISQSETDPKFIREYNIQSSYQEPMGHGCHSRSSHERQFSTLCTQ
jgi:hypothetical protein